MSEFGGPSESRGRGQTGVPAESTKLRLDVNISDLQNRLAKALTDLELSQKMQRDAEEEVGRLQGVVERMTVHEAQLQRTIQVHKEYMEKTPAPRKTPRAHMDFDSNAPLRPVTPPQQVSARSSQAFDGSKKLDQPWRPLETERSSSQIFAAPKLPANVQGAMQPHPRMEQPRGRAQLAVLGAGTRSSGPSTPSASFSGSFPDPTRYKVENPARFAQLTPAPRTDGARVKSPRDATATRQIPTRHDTPSQSDSGPMSSFGALTITDTTREHPDFKSGCVRIFRLIKEWTLRYASEPQARDINMDADFRNAMKIITHAQSVQSLFRDSEVRPLMITRYILDTVIREVWRINIVKEFDKMPAESSQIAEMRKSIKPGMPEPTKAAMYTVQAEAVAAMRRHPGFAAYLKWKSGQTGQALFKTLTPFLKPESQKALADLRWLWHDLHHFGVEMQCHARLYRFDFIKPGPMSFFRPDTMVSVDHKITGTPEEMLKGDHRVSLSVTPVVMMTDLAAGTIAPKMIAKSEVLLHN